MNFTLTEDLKERILAYNDYAYAKDSTPEPINPWPPIIEEMVERVERTVTPGFSNLDEMAFEYLSVDEPDPGHFEMRFELTPNDVNHLFKEWEEYRVLYPYM